MAPGTGGISGHQQPSPLLRLTGSTGAVPAMLTLSVAAVGAARALPGQRTNTGSMAATSGCRWRLWAAWMARCRIASALRASMPSPWRVKALCSEGPVVPSWAAAALMLPSRSARAKARSASDQSIRKRLGLPAYPTTGQAKAPLVAVGDSSTSVRRWVDRVVGFDPCRRVDRGLNWWLHRFCYSRLLPVAKLERPSRTHVRIKASQPADSQNSGPSSLWNSCSATLASADQFRHAKVTT